MTFVLAESAEGTTKRIEVYEFHRQLTCRGECVVKALEVSRFARGNVFFCSAKEFSIGSIYMSLFFTRPLNRFSVALDSRPERRLAVENCEIWLKLTLNIMP